MIQYRAFMRRVLVDVYNINTVKPWHRLVFSIVNELNNTESARNKREREKEIEHQKDGKLIEALSIYITRCINEWFYKNSDNYEFLILVDRKFEKVLPKVIEKKDFLGYKLKMLSLPYGALKTIDNLRLPLRVTKDM